MAYVVMRTGTCLREGRETSLLPEHAGRFEIVASVNAVFLVLL